MSCCSGCLVVLLRVCCSKCLLVADAGVVLWCSAAGAVRGVLLRVPGSVLFVVLGVAGVLVFRCRAALSSHVPSALFRVLGAEQCSGCLCSAVPGALCRRLQFLSGLQLIVWLPDHLQPGAWSLTFMLWLLRGLGLHATITAFHLSIKPDLRVDALVLQQAQCFPLARRAWRSCHLAPLPHLPRFFRLWLAVLASMAP